MEQENLLPTLSTDTLTPERKKELTDIVIPAIQATMRDNNPKSNLKNFLESVRHYQTGRISDLLTELAGQHIFQGEVEIIYASQGVEY